MPSSRVIYDIASSAAARKVASGAPCRATSKRVAIASAKQCRRAVVPDVRAPISFHDMCRDPSALKLLLVEPSAAEAGSGLRQMRKIPSPATALLAVGPEGGWTDAEVDAARAAGFIAVTLGRRTLRADAVVVSAVSVFQYIWGDL